jgi:hypothetical protein
MIEVDRQDRERTERTERTKKQSAIDRPLLISGFDDRMMIELIVAEEPRASRATFVAKGSNEHVGLI